MPSIKNVEKKIKHYIFVRDEIERKKEAFKESLQELVDLKSSLEGWLQQFMDDASVESVKTSEGTCYSVIKSTASLADPDIFMSYVIANEEYDLLDRRANITAVKAFVADHGQPPPGCNISSIQSVNVRRPTDRK